MVEIVDFAVRATGIDGLVVLTMKQVTDDRGTVREFYRESAFVDAGLPSLGPWVQVNVTETRRGAIRGMHGEQMHKLVAVAAGRGFGAYVDSRPDSPSAGEVEVVELTPGTQVLVPPGVCNGFQSCSESMQYVYCFDQEWQPGMAGVAVNPLDPELAIVWPEPFDADDPTMVSAKDRGAPSLAEVLRADDSR
ncbi:dTDP-4-dehydrorhamnose 3,5-epimerase family protein [Actinospongicola halichondriae]|uniref:dTDP-4-dehydrorhamnose 3,5-epimerase family protein n=1 Tax=Actinospongicola halichondriae TaxID=3236844 RepID=UPI003D4BF533